MNTRQSTFPKLLAIDGSDLIHRLLRVRLQSERIDILSARTTEEGLAMACDHMPDVILLDVETHVGSSLAALHALKSDQVTHDIPVILLSGSATTAEKVRGLDMGAIDFVAKPFEIAELTARVRSAIQIRQLMRMLAERARIDALTGLGNRAYLDERLAQEVADAVRRKAPLSLIFCDLDHFKAINDTYGHQFGDAVLREFSGILTGGRSGDIACRYGGEEFVAILPDCGAQQAFTASERMRQELRSTTWEGHPRLTVTASFGVSDLIRLRYPTPEALLNSADHALYAAKKSGRDRVCIAAQESSQMPLAA
jgi:diguanylate cyclase (GGDEF)-like protein